MKYCSFEEAYNSPFSNEEEDISPGVAGYEDTVKDFYESVDNSCDEVKKHCEKCHSCSLLLNKNGNDDGLLLVEGFKQTGKNNILLILLILLLLWTLLKK